MEIMTLSVSRPEFLSKVPSCDPAAVRVAVLMGGDSSERQVSLMSGREVSRALRAVGFQVTDVDLKPSEVDRLASLPVDVAFIALHGRFGEDGTLQRRLDEMGILYVGSGSAAGRTAMDKARAKEKFVLARIATPAWRVVRRGDAASARVAYETLGPAVVTKPLDDGSSIGVTLVDSWPQYESGLAEVFRTREAALVETRIRGRELTVGVLHTEGLPIVEIVPRQQFYNYEAKYFDEGTAYVLNPELPPGASARVRQAAVAGHRALGCRDFSRVDIMLDESGTHWVLEVNTIPGFTTHSLLPKSASGAGIDFSSLCRYIVELALLRGRRRVAGKSRERSRRA